MGEIRQHHQAEALNRVDEPVTYAQKVFSLNPRYYWPLDEREDATVENQLSYGTNGTLTLSSIDRFQQPGGVSNTTAMRLKSATPSYLYCADHADFKDTTDSLTIAAWVRLETAQIHNIVSKTGGSGSNGTYLFFTTSTADKLVFSFWRGTSTNEYFTSTKAVDLTDGWHHVAMTHKWGDAGTRLYVDGVDVGGTWTGNDGTGSPITSTDPFKIGARSQDNANPLNGLIQHVVYTTEYYNAEQIALLAEAT